MARESSKHPTSNSPNQDRLEDIGTSVLIIVAGVVLFLAGSDHVLVLNFLGIRLISVDTLWIIGAILGTLLLIVELGGLMRERNNNQNLLSTDHEPVTVSETFDEYVADEAYTNGSFNDPDTHYMEEGWEKMLDELDGKPSELINGYWQPKTPPETEIDYTENMAEYLEQNYKSDEIARLVRYRQDNQKWEIEHEDRSGEEIMKLTRIQTTDNGELKTNLNF